MADIAENPANVPPPITRREPATVQIDLETIEIEAHLDQNSIYRFWTFNGRVPRPFQRVRVGDTVEVRVRNREDSWYAHNVDLHAVTGPGGGAEVTTVAPGVERRFRVKALIPGLYVYHGAVPPVALHIASGMYGMRGTGGGAAAGRSRVLRHAGRDLYRGSLRFDKLLEERAEYSVFNGHVGALTDHYPLQARVGETVRIYFGVEDRTMSRPST